LATRLFSATKYAKLETDAKAAVARVIAHEGLDPDLVEALYKQGWREIAAAAFAELAPHVGGDAAAQKLVAAARKPAAPKPTAEPSRRSGGNAREPPSPSNRADDRRECRGPQALAERWRSIVVLSCVVRLTLVEGSVD